MSLKKAFIYLASQSPRRREILKKIGIAFKVVPSSYHEKRIPGLSPERLVLRHAWGKASGAHIPGKAGWVLGADTVVCCRKKILGKPKTMKDAFKMMRFLSGKCHEVYTGMILHQRSSGKMYSGLAVTKVYFQKLRQNDIEEYFKKVNPLDKAGAYAIQEGPAVVKKIEGSYTNIVGLPVELVRWMLKNI